MRKNLTPCVVPYERTKYDVMKKIPYSITQDGQVYSHLSNTWMVPQRDCVGLRINGKSTRYRVSHLILWAFRPDLTEKLIPGIQYAADHIVTNGPNHVDNLQWLTHSEHSKKTHAETRGNRKSQARMAGKAVFIAEVRGKRSPDLIGTEYDSACSAATSLDIVATHVSRSARKGFWVRDLKFKFVPQVENLEGEQWTNFHGYLVSNMGRVRTPRGKITKGCEEFYRRHNKQQRYKRIGLTINGKLKKWSMHVLVWTAWHGPVPKGFMVLHDDSNHVLTRDKRGYERNFLCDLSIGTASDNQVSRHENAPEHTLTRVRCIENSIVYRGATDAARSLGLKWPQQITACCKGFRKSTGGLTFEYYK